jgi:hypothetical protein
MNKPLYEKRTKRIKSISPARAERLREYERLKRAWRKDTANQVCHFGGCTRPAEPNPHHSRGRIGKLLNAVEFWRAVCVSHHNLIHSNPALAREMGFLPPVGQWNTFPKANPS